MRRSAGGCREGRAAATARHDRTGGRELNCGDRGRFPHWRRAGLLQHDRRFRAGAASEPINWHCTAFHELGHWTGHKSRLDREHSGSFGSKSYAREELVAEMAGAFVCASLGIVPTVRHADYIGSWLEVLREDNRAIVRAASAASKAADHILGFQSVTQQRAETSHAADDQEAA